MTEQTIIVDIKCGCDIIYLGKQGEHKVRKIIFDLSKMIDTYGEGTATVVFKRNEFDSPYAIVIDIIGENKLEWIVTNTDTHKAGTGFCEVRYYVGESLAKSIVYKTHVRHSIHSALTQVKTPMQDIIDKLSEAAKTILDKFSDIVELADKTEKASKDAEVYKEGSFEFSEISRTYSELAEAYSNHPPIISEHDTWLVWNGNEYIDTGLPTRGEPVDPVIIRAYVEAYLKENPPHVEEVDPTVPEWAKKPNKPSYNVSEITDAVDIGTLEDVEATINQNIDRVEEIANSAYDLADEAETIAKGKSRARVFETVQLMEQWIVQHKTELQVGDNFYIVAKDVPDYWWDGTRVQELETQKVDLAEYAKKADVKTKLSELESDSTHRIVTDVEKQTWNNKSDFSGSYDDLRNKPNIPSLEGYATEQYVDDAVPTKLSDLLDDEAHRTVTDEQINEWNNKQAGTGIDDKSITRTQDNKLQSVGNVVNDGSVQKYWVGTKSQFDAIQEKESSTIYEVLDDEEQALFEVDGASIEFSPDGLLRVPTNIDLMFQSVLYGNGESGYRKYRNGMLEQWGVATTGLTETEFTMHQPHKDMNFSVFVEPRERGNFFHYAVPSANQKFKCRTQTKDGEPIAIKVQWRSWGRWK